MQNNKLIIPLAIIVAGALVGGAIVYTNKNSAGNSAPKQVATTPKTATIKPVTSADHILGNPDAKVLMVEYSDTECPFCKLFTPTMEKIIDTYAKDGSVAWVYRQFPIAALHSRAPKEAEATECVNKIAGNDVFWKYLQKIYAVTPANNGLDPAQLAILAAGFGVDKNAFQACLDSNTFTTKIQSDYNDAIAAGGQGTPYTVLLSKTPLNDGKIKQINDIFASAATGYNLTADQLGYVTTDKKVVLNGNLPYELVQQIISTMIS
jgi:protein-disulfide isomerase